MNCLSSICFKPCVPSKVLYPRTSSTKFTTMVRASLQDPQPPNTSQQQQLNLSVLRFTLGLSLSLYAHTWCKGAFVTLFSHWYLGCFCFRDTWVWWILLAQMDWLWLWFAFALKSLSWFWLSHCYTSTACKRRFLRKILNVIFLFFIQLNLFIFLGVGFNCCVFSLSCRVQRFWVCHWLHSLLCCLTLANSSRYLLSMFSNASIQPEWI